MSATTDQALDAIEQALDDLERIRTVALRGAIADARAHLEDGRPDQALTVLARHSHLATAHLAAHHGRLEL